MRHVPRLGSQEDRRGGLGGRVRRHHPARQGFKEKDAWGTEPEPGALVFFAWSGSKDIDAISHVGLVESVKGSTLRTIEANTDGVHLKRRTRDVGDVVGYGYPGKVEVAGKALPGSEGEKNHVPKHVAAESGTMAAEATRPGNAVTSQQTSTKAADGQPLVEPDALLGGLLSIAVCGAVALAAGKSMAARVPAEAEDREFWSRVSPLEDDEDLAFWDALHADLPPIRSNATGRAAVGHSLP
ncbi:CHAP domain-containing protein [Spirillospora sp. NPDC048824]|uniref:CHAP domain-containing protein n=1 Tax=Spirillospora sp. NPDC048824 TaxID=3364526 RepID=UPI00371C19E5